MEGQLDFLARDLAKASRYLNRNLQMITVILDVYGNEEFWEEALASRSDDALKMLTAIMFLTTLDGEVGQSRELALVLAASSGVYMDEDTQQMVVASAEPIIKRLGDD